MKVQDAMKVKLNILEEVEEMNRTNKIQNFNNPLKNKRKMNGGIRYLNGEVNKDNYYELEHANNKYHNINSKHDNHKNRLL